MHIISDPVSRKTKSSGRNKAGFCVYLAYQLFDNVTHNQMVGEALNQCVDITIKRKQLLQALTEAKIPPQIDEKVRKSIFLGASMTTPREANNGLPSVQCRPSLVFDSHTRQAGILAAVTFHRCRHSMGSPRTNPNNTARTTPWMPW